MKQSSDTELQKVRFLLGSESKNAPTSWSYVYLLRCIVHALLFIGFCIKEK